MHRAGQHIEVTRKEIGMSKFKMHLWVGPLLALACAGTATFAATATTTAGTQPPRQEAMPKQAEAPAKTVSLKESLANVSEIAAELKSIDKRLQSLEHSVAGINTSLAPLGALTQPAGLSALFLQVGDLAYERGRVLIFLAAAYAAGLIVLFSVLRRWSNRSGKA